MTNRIWGKPFLAFPNHISPTGVYDTGDINSKVDPLRIPFCNMSILKKGNMRNFNLKQVFTFIYIPSSTFDHNKTTEEQRQTLHCIRKHLKKKGILAFDLEQVTSDKTESSWWIDQKELDDGRVIVRSIFTRRDARAHAEGRKTRWDHHHL